MPSRSRSRGERKSRRRESPSPARRRFTETSHPEVQRAVTVEALTRAEQAAASAVQGMQRLEEGTRSRSRSRSRRRHKRRHKRSRSGPRDSGAERSDTAAGSATEKPKLSAAMAALLGESRSSEGTASSSLKPKLRKGPPPPPPIPAEDPQQRTETPKLSAAMAALLGGSGAPSAVIPTAPVDRSRTASTGARFMPTLTGASAERSRGVRGPIHCRDFKLGICRWGAECHFLHDQGGLPPAEVLAQLNSMNALGPLAPVPRSRHEGRDFVVERCIEFKLGRCTKGKDCRRLHDLSVQNVQPGNTFFIKKT